MVATPKSRSPKSSGDTSSGKSSLANSSALADIQGFNGVLSTLIKKNPGVNDEENDDFAGLKLSAEDEKKRLKLVGQRKRLMKAALSYQPHIDSDKSGNALREYTQRMSKVAKIDRKIDFLVGDDEISDDGSAGSINLLA